MVVARTNRLLLRRWRDDDLDAFARLTGDPRVVRWMGDGAVLDRETTARWITKSQQNYAARGYGVWAVAEAASGEVIGWAGITQTGHSEEGTSAELVYAFAPERWGQGLATETVGAILDWTWRETALRRVIATIAPENAASQRVLEKLGFRWTGDSEKDGETTRWMVRDR